MDKTILSMLSEILKNFLVHKDHIEIFYLKENKLFSEVCNIAKISDVIED